jgi:hypothetical protein
VATTTSATTSTVDFWRYWNTATSTAGTLRVEPWRTWTATTTTGTITNLAYNPTFTWDQWTELPDEHRWQEPAVELARLYPRHEPTQAELDAAQRRREEHSARLLADRQRLAVAQPRALELLRSLLTDVQIAQMDRTGEIRVDGSDGGRYVIEVGDGRVHGNIRAVDEHGCVLGRLCVQPDMYDVGVGALPSADGHVGQLLAIRFNEQALLAKANWSFRQFCQQPGGLRAA